MGSIKEEMTVKRLCLLLLICALLCSMSGCRRFDYDPDWIIGKNSAEIQKRYGAFDFCNAEASDDGLVRDCVATYYIRKDAKQLFGDPLPDIKFHIWFDETGIAYKAYRREDFP